MNVAKETALILKTAENAANARTETEEKETTTENAINSKRAVQDKTFTTKVNEIPNEARAVPRHLSKKAEKPKDFRKSSNAT